MELEKTCVSCTQPDHQTYTVIKSTAVIGSSLQDGMSSKSNLQDSVGELQLECDSHWQHQHIVGNRG